MVRGARKQIQNYGYVTHHTMSFQYYSIGVFWKMYRDYLTPGRNFTNYLTPAQVSRICIRRRNLGIRTRYQY